MTAQKSSVEFLPQEDWEKTRLGKILKWALTVGRYIVVFTELIVIAAFLSRFKLDRDLTDLHEEIGEKVAVIQAASDFEKEFRFLQKRVTTIKELKEGQPEAEEIITQLASLIPVNVTLSDLNVRGRKVTLTATALSESGLATFLNNLKASNRFRNVVLSEVVSGRTKEIGISFSLTTDLAKKENGL